MNFVLLYLRVLELLGPEAKLAWLLAVANIALAAAQFAEPVLFGRIVDLMATAQGKGVAPDWNDLLTLAAAWVGFGLFSIGSGVLEMVIPTDGRSAQPHRTVIRRRQSLMGHGARCLD